MAESWFLVWTENYNYSCVSESLNSSHISVFDHWIFDPKYPYHCILWIYTWKIASRLWGIKHIALHHMHIFVEIILYNVSCSLPHVIHTDSIQYKQLQNSILSITSDHANVWVYIWVLFKSNIPVPLKFMSILLWYLNCLWVLSHPLLFSLCVSSEKKYQVSQRTHCTYIKLNLIDNFNISILNKTKLCVFTCF
jgi:hypothetical protein